MILENQEFTSVTILNKCWFSSHTLKEVKNMIKMSKEAAEKFRNLITTSKNPGNTMVRVSFGGYG